jgi:hypothetical protein
MDAKEIGELLDIYAIHDTKNSSAFTFAVKRDIFINRGWLEDQIEDLIFGEDAEENSEH